MAGPKRMNQMRDSERFELFERRVRLALETAKLVMLTVGAIAVFLIIRRPESILGQASSIEAIARERAALMLRYLDEEDPQKRADAFAVIRAAYGNNNDWLSKVEDTFNKRARSIALAQAIGKLSEILKLEDELEKKLAVATEAEVRGVSGTGLVGRGPAYLAIQREREAVRFRLEALDEVLSALGLADHDIQRLHSGEPVKLP